MGWEEEEGRKDGVNERSVHGTRGGDGEEAGNWAKERGGIRRGIMTLCAVFEFQAVPASPSVDTIIRPLKLVKTDHTTSLYSATLSRHLHQYLSFFGKRNNIRPIYSFVWQNTSSFTKTAEVGYCRLMGLYVDTAECVKYRAVILTP